MRFFSTLALASAAFVSSVLADDIIHERYVRSLDKRQEFTPTTQTATGNTCADAFGEGYVVCRESSATQNRLCYNPDAGQTCCSTSWACPSDSFCFGQGNCCPNGLSQSACAAKFSSSAAATSAPAAPTTAPVNTTSSSIASVYTPYPSGNATVPQPTGAPTTPAQFTGAASAMSVEVGAVALGGVFALFSLL